MERKLLRKEVEKLLGDYVSTTLREKEFDPKGRRECSSIDDLAHYDLAIGVALQWLSSSKSNEELKKGKLKLAINHHKYPNRMEREAMILSSFAGLLMNSFPVEDVFEIYGSIYGSKPSTTQLQNSAKVHLTQPFSLSLHPFAMLTAPQAAIHALKHCTRLCKSSGRNETILSQDRDSAIDQREIKVVHSGASLKEGRSNMWALQGPEREETTTESETEEDTIVKSENDINQ